MNVSRKPAAACLTAARTPRAGATEIHAMLPGDALLLEDIGTRWRGDAEIEDPSVKKINLFVFAAHHLSGNIAAQRFRALLKYLDPAKYRVFVLTREPAAGVHAANAATGPETSIHAFPGRCVGSESSAAASALALTAAFVHSLPAMLANGDAQTRPWLAPAWAEADRLCGERLAEGEPCVAIGTYSPVDALIAAAALASRRRIACLQDFRDGLVFESLGRGGRLRDFARRAIERRVVAPAALITSVSRPLVEDFRRRYPDKATVNLPNGFDPDDFARLPADTGSAGRAAAILAQQVPAGAQLIGHFGRIGASDSSASNSLDCFVDLLNGAPELAAGRHVMFVGELTEAERASLRRARFSVGMLGPVERALALQLMRRCDKLLLLTGTRTSCATGKLFEYLAAGAPVVCVSGVPNEATAILDETGAGQSLLTSVAAGGEALRAALAPAPANVRRDVSTYSRIVQAGLLDRWLAHMVAA